MAKRRANGEGSIRKRKDGRWEGRYTAGHDSVTGKQIFKNVLGKTQAEVKEKLKQAIADNAGVDIVKSDEYTVGQWMDLWFENYCKLQVRQSSHQTYQGYIKNHIKPYIGEVKLNKLTTLDLQKLYGKLLESGRVERIEAAKQSNGLSPKTVRNIHNVISAALDKAKLERLIVHNPADGCTLPQQERREMRTLPLEQLDRFFAEARESGVFEQYYTEMATGLRRGELLGLKWEDIDFDQLTISVRRQVLRLGGVVQEAPLKTKNAYRTISISQELADILKAKCEREQRGQNHEHEQGSGHEQVIDWGQVQSQERENGLSDYVFASPTGGPISPDSVLHMLHRVLKRAGMEKIRYHDLRHTFATLALQNGVDIKTLSNMLGHYSAAFTLDTYAHVTTTMQRDAAEKVGNFLQQSIGQNQRQPPQNETP